MKVEYDLPEQLIHTVAARAATWGMTVDAYVASLLTANEVKDPTAPPATLGEFIQDAIRQRKRRKEELITLAQGATLVMLSAPFDKEHTIADMLEPGVWDSLPYVNRVALGTLVRTNLLNYSNIRIGDIVNGRRVFVRLPDPTPVPRQ